MAPNRSLSSALALIKIKRFADNWLQIGDAIDYDELVALVDALDYLKKDAQEKMTIRRASQVSMQTHLRPACVGSANQGVRRSSRRLASAPQYASTGSLFVSEVETESESSSQNDGIQSPMLREENHDENETRNAAAEIRINHPTLLHVDNDSQADKILPERNFGDTISQLRHPIEQEQFSPAPCTARLVSNEQDECTDVQPMQDLNEAPNVQVYQETSATALYQSSEDSEDVENQQFPELSHSSLVHQPQLGLMNQDISDSLFGGEEFGEGIFNNLPSPQYFNEAFEDLYSTSIHDEVQRDVEDTATYPDEQYPTNRSDIEDFDDDPTVQGYLDIAFRSGFRLPHETAEDADCVDAQEVLLPLLKERPPTSRLLHGILYTLLPGPILIIDFCSGSFDSEAVEGSTNTDFVAIVRRSEDSSPLLVVGLETSKTFFILDSETWDLPSLGIPWLIRPEWKTEYTDLVRLETQLQTSEVFVPNLENFELEALRESLLRKPSEINRGRCLRILQCVNEIGSPHILESLKLACTRKEESQTYSAIEQPIFEKLFHIHLYLDRQESQSHILVARNRYIKYCYFETYLRAVKALQEEKRNSTQERRRVSARKRTTSFKQGISEILPPTPHTEEIHRVYENLSPSQRKRRAPDMVKDEISKKVVNQYGGNEKRIRRNINRYIKDGRVLHHILRGGRSLDPALLILFPSFGSDLPSLSMAQFGLELEELEEKALMEAAWFGEVLQARPELLEPVPKAAVDLISNTLTYDLDVQGRDPDSFRDYYLKGEMKTEPGSNATNEDVWPCLGAISIDRLNMLVFWESSWLSTHLLYEFSIEVRKDRPGLLGYVAANALPPSSTARSRLPAFLAYWKVARMTKGLFYYLQQTYSSHWGYIVHEESGKVWIQWEPTWVVFENLNESKKEQLLQISHDPEAILHRFYKAIVQYSMRLVVERRISKRTIN
ncbi:hypothetical protein COCCADRAFT_42009 [Bipolaris zeicola 26-R-13]|uniref:Uncharacterized protein n=1 Tax=Cochliobolus carbonum (strain 26-R-13) TaxID=930089 RepID=W6XPM5_COCC2|nr:uncharacterized protein COCCADRAFT_42009 [Bipolaris zeicola 26-R-13]EUC27185.1 hypothetical protein COCCADRAFT_42009 [Bipolaris zeicola 26-R-13]